MPWYNVAPTQTVATLIEEGTRHLERPPPRRPLGAVLPTERAARGHGGRAQNAAAPRLLLWKGIHAGDRTPAPTVARTHPPCQHRPTAAGWWTRWPSTAPRS